MKRDEPVIDYASPQTRAPEQDDRGYAWRITLFVAALGVTIWMLLKIVEYIP